MSAASSADNTGKSSKGSKKILVIVLLLLVGIGGGGFFYLNQVKAADAKENGKSNKKGQKSKKGKEKKGQQKRLKDEQDQIADGKSSQESEDYSLELPEDENVKQIIELQPFIVNLADQDESRYLRISISVGVGESKTKEEEKIDPLLITRLRNAMLTTLMRKRSDEIRSVEGKAKLKKQLLESAHLAIEEPEVEAIYITDFIIQL
jgi:flagellar protein FliL